MNLLDLNDEELVVLAQNGNPDAKEIVVERKKNLVKSIARSFFLVGGDEEDLLIEGMIGVSKAVDGYNPNSDFSNNEKTRGEFNAYAKKCIRNQIIIAIRKANSSKNAPLNYYVPLTGLNDDGDKSQLVIDSVSDPETEYIDRENAEELLRKIKDKLTDLENEILAMYLNGYSYSEIGLKVHKNSKSAENAIQRIRRKVKEII